MISDTLFEAEAEIRQYQRCRPQAYDPLKPRLDALRAHMIAFVSNWIAILMIRSNGSPATPPMWLRWPVIPAPATPIWTVTTASIRHG